MNSKRDCVMNWAGHTYLEGHKLSDYDLWVEVDVFRAKSKWAYDNVMKYKENVRGKWDDIIIGGVPEEIFVVKMTLIDESRTEARFLRSLLESRETGKVQRSVDKPLSVEITLGAGMDFTGSMHVTRVVGVDVWTREITLTGYCDGTRLLYAKLETHPLILDEYQDYIPEPVIEIAGEPDETGVS